MRKWYPAIVIALAFVFSAVVYGRLPERVPVHWNLSGEVDRMGSRLEGAFLLPLLALALWGAMRVFPRIDPRKANYERFRGTYDFLVNSLITMFVLFHVVVLGNALGWPLPLTRIVPALIGLFLIAIGNVLPRARSNWWIGVRTPWTLSSEHVWARTNRLAGYLLMGTGVVLLIFAALASPWALTMGAVAAAVIAVFSITYSYWLWRKEKRA
ncbi:MAG: SdpI family protein [Longimicrobiales bacterium]